MRNVTEEGVSHVMRVFFEAMTEGRDTAQPDAQVPPETEDFERFNRIVQVICDEEALDR